MNKTPLEILAEETNTITTDWETTDGQDSGVGTDYWYRHNPTGKEAYLNLDQGHLIVSVVDEKNNTTSVDTESNIYTELDIY